MPGLSPEKPGDVIQKLRRLGFDGPFGGGRHVFMRHPLCIRFNLLYPIRYAAGRR